MIVFENEDLLVADKPNNVLTTPARDHDDPRRCLGRELQTQLGKQIYPVHRLDFEVSGLVLFAKTPAAHRATQSWFEMQEVDKFYLARAENVPAPDLIVDWMEWRSRLVRGKRRSFEAPHGQEALTRVRTLEDGSFELQPVTGRPHQLRFEMSKHGFPILGDVLYGARLRVEDGIRLRAVRLNFARVKERFGLPLELAAVPSTSSKR